MLYFAYGSNMSRAAMARRCPHAQALGVAVLEGFTFFVGQEGWGSVKRRAGGNVRGVLWRLTLRDLAVLHAYELLHKGLYVVRHLPVLFSGRRLKAMAYVLRRQAGGRPHPGYIESMVAAAHEWNLPPAYIRGVARHAAARRAPRPLGPAA